MGIIVASRAQEHNTGPGSNIPDTAHGKSDARHRQVHLPNLMVVDGEVISL